MIAALASGSFAGVASAHATFTPGAQAPTSNNAPGRTPVGPGSGGGTPHSSVEAVCPPPTPGKVECLSFRRTDLGGPVSRAVVPAVTTQPYTPADLQSAYALPSASRGAGLTVAIVDAYDLPTAESDLATYRSEFGLSACSAASGCFRKVDQAGGSNYPAADANWGLEIALDLDMASAICPNCKILLVEANDSMLDNMGQGVNTAVALGAFAVSNSYGGFDSSSDSTYDYSYYDHPGVVITAASGDCGYNCTGHLPSNAYLGVEYPASSPYVVAVGGTNLAPASNARGWTESAWGSISEDAGAGSGCSAYEYKPGWQVDSGCSGRTVADVSAVADPNPGVWTFEGGGWYSMGGTSAASPIIAATYALAGRVTAGSYPASYLYNNAGALHDVVGGNNLVTNQSCTITYLCNGVTGYDGPTGLGTPNGVAAFASPNTVPGPPANVIAAPHNASAQVSWSAPADNGGSAITGYTAVSSPGGRSCNTSGTSCAVTGLTNGQPYTFTVTARNSVGTSVPSSPSSPVVPVTVPGAPTGVIATPGDTQAQVSWSAPLATGGSPITGYTVTSSPQGRTCAWPAGPLGCTVTGLANGQPYTFTVTATNSVGTGPSSSASAPVTPATVPGAPTGVVAIPYNLSALVSWTPPADNGGNAITGYQVRSSDGETCTSTGGLSCAVTGLANGTPYTFTVTATNSVGPGSASNPSVAVVPVQVPNAPSGVATTRGWGAITVSWAAPADNGSTITGYTVTSSPGGQTCTWASGPLSCTVSSLEADTPYTFTVTATNSSGTGPASAPSAFVTPISGDTYHAVAPARVLDSRFSTGGTVFHSRVRQTVLVATGASGVPADAVAVTGNVTVTGQTAAGYVVVAPSLTSGVQPRTSTLNFPLGDNRANGVTVQLAAGGNLDFMYWSGSTSATAQVLFDVTGYFSADASGDTYHAVAPARVLDSRFSTGGTVFHSRVRQTVLVATGASGVPADAVAVTGNVTVTGQTAAGYVVVAPSLTSGVQPRTSTLNFPLGDNRANGVTVQLAAGGNLDFMYWSGSTSATAQVLFDVTGYFTP